MAVASQEAAAEAAGAVAGNKVAWGRMNFPLMSAIKVIWNQVRNVVLSLITLYLILCALLFYFQRSLLYFPTVLPPGAACCIEKLSVDGAELTLSVKAGPGNDAIIYFGGNAEEVSATLDEFAGHFPEHGIVLQHYRGYGGSTGKPSEAVLHADAQAVYDLVKTRYSNIAVVGRSLGSGVAIRVAANNPVSQLVLVTPYDSILSLARGRFPFVPVSLLLRDKFLSIDYAPLIEVPVLAIIAEQDQLVPHSHTDVLLNAFAPGISRTVTIPGTDHNTIGSEENYYAVILEFLTQNR